MNKLKNLKPFFLNLVLLWFAILLYKTLPYYQKFLSTQTQKILIILAATYTIIGFVYYFFKPQTQSKGTLVLNAIKKSTRKIYKYFTDPMVVTENVSKKEKIIILFILVKFFFLPIMLNFTVGNLNAVSQQVTRLPSTITLNSFNYFFFPFIISIIFLIDTLYFAVGYSTESGLLKNKIKSVEPTIFGWLVAIACYPPFNSIVTKQTDWYSNIYIILPSVTTTFLIKISIIALFIIYLSATLSLGTKSSNLTNRGIVTRGTYSIIRHPAYISKNLAWWLAIIPIISWPAFISMSVWSIIYHLRTITEERHLSQDPDYIEYKKQVKYRYIPYIY